METQEVVVNPMVKRLLNMLAYRRPDGKSGTRLFVERFIKPYAPLVYRDPKTMEAFAYVIEVDNPDLTPSTTMFSSHVDTVHHDDAMQIPQFDANLGLIYKTDGTPLGADDGAGVWLLLEMIDAGVPGSYWFHEGEECGGIGSSGMAKHYSEVLKRFTHAIAFDRRGTCSVITHQGGNRCCSDDFANELSGRLSAKTKFTLKPDDTGSFTDTKKYVGVIGECTNVSIGYDSEHSKEETADMEYLLALRIAALDPTTWENLPNVRVAGTVESKWGGGSRYGRYWDYDDWDTYGNGYKAPASEFKTALDKDDKDDDKYGGAEYEDEYEYALANSVTKAEDLYALAFDEIADWVSVADPYTVADMIFDLLYQSKEK